MKGCNITKESTALSMSKSEEFATMAKFAMENDFEWQNGEPKETMEWQQLRALWTAYCIHHDLECDMRNYDKDIFSLWKAALHENILGDEMKPFAVFDLYMAEWLC